MSSSAPDGYDSAVERELARLRREVAELRAAAGEDEGEAPNKGAPPRTRKLLLKLRQSSKARGILMGAVALLAIGLVLWVHYIRSYESTDDAQIDGDITTVAPRVSGTVMAVYVVDNQPVRAGDLLGELDPRVYEVALGTAKAQLAEAQANVASGTPSVTITAVSSATNVATTAKDIATAEAGLAAAQRDYEAALGTEQKARAEAENARTEFMRSQRLYRTGAISKAEYDQSRTAAAAADGAETNARANVASMRQRVSEQRAKLAQAESRAGEAKETASPQLRSQEALVAARQAGAEAAQSALEQAELNLSYTKIYAPVDGIVARRSMNVGDRVESGQELMFLVRTDQLWVTANFRETQIRELRQGQRAKIHVDALDVDYVGAVESFAGATGSRLSLFPPENATGNFVKVVQRIPVRISIAAGQRGAERLRPGMSVEPKVYLD